MNNPFLQHAKMIAMQHYGGHPPDAWIQRLSAMPEGQTPLARMFLSRMGLGMMQGMAAPPPMQHLQQQAPIPNQQRYPAPPLY